MSITRKPRTNIKRKPPNINEQATTFLKRLAQSAPKEMRDVSGLLGSGFSPITNPDHAITFMNYARFRHDVQLHFAKEGYSFWVRLEGNWATLSPCQVVQLSFGPDMAQVITLGILALRKNHNKDNSNSNAHWVK